MKNKHPCTERTKIPLKIKNVFYVLFLPILSGDGFLAHEGLFLLAVSHHYRVRLRELHEALPKQNNK